MTKSSSSGKGPIERMLVIYTEIVFHIMDEFTIKGCGCKATCVPYLVCGDIFIHHLRSLLRTSPAAGTYLLSHSKAFGLNKTNNAIWRLYNFNTEVIHQCMFEPDLDSKEEQALRFKNGPQNDSSQK